MAHAAEINSATGEVLRVIVVSDEFEPNVEAWCVKNYGGVWKQTSYNANIRKNFAGVGFSYRSDLDAFVPPKPFPSWVLDTSTAQWKAPVTKPTSGFYIWDEPSQSWKPDPSPYG